MIFNLILFAAAAATTIGNFPNWKIEKTKDALTDESSCTGYYRGRKDIQLSSGGLYLLTKVGPSGVFLRFGEEPAQPFRLATQEEQELRAIIIKMAESRVSPQKAEHDTEYKKLQAEFEKRRELYYQGLISREGVLQVERALAEAMIRVDQDKALEADMTYHEFSQIKRLRFKASTILKTVVEGDLDLKDAGNALELIRSPKCRR